MKLQLEDRSVQKYKEIDSPVVMGDQMVAFEERGSILCRIYQHPKVNNGQPVRQVIVPESLCRQVMQLAHDSLMGRHLGAKKTVHLILLARNQERYVTLLLLMRSMSEDGFER